MNKIVCFGEALIDFLNTGSESSGDISIPVFKQFPGGAPANAAVAVAKLGGHSYFAGQVGADTFGQFLRDTLAHYGVHLDFMHAHPKAKTALAFVTLDADGDRSFSFYRDETADIVVQANQFPDDMLAAGDILHVCSNTLTTETIKDTTLNLCKQAADNGAFISFDVNLRHNLWRDGEADKSSVEALVKMANLIKFSREEIEYLAGNNHIDYINRLLSENCHLAIVTDGGQAVRYYTKGFSGQLAIPEVEVVDTTSGGDAFVGGLLCALQESKDLVGVLTDQTATINAVSFAIQCGAYTVARQGAFPAIPWRKDITN